MTSTTYADVLVRNIRAARSRLGLGQESVAARMCALGYGAWLRQTVGSVERGHRRLAAEEILGLALALETTIAALMGARDQDGYVALPGGMALSAASVERSAGRGVNDRPVNWDGDAIALEADDGPPGAARV